jgi:hypothetical protein
VAGELLRGKASSAHHKRAKPNGFSIEGTVLREIGATKPHECSIPRHNWRMNQRAKLSTPCVISHRALAGMVQSNGVYLPRQALIVSASIAARQINAYR